MTDALKQAERQLLEPGGIDHRELERVLETLMGPAVEAGDLYFQSTRFESWVLEDGIVKEGSHSIEQGAGLRAISGEKTGFAYTDSLDLDRLLEDSRVAGLRPG